jgi:hypothetical protein
MITGYIHKTTANLAVFCFSITPTAIWQLPQGGRYGMMPQDFVL